jgi:hypothetical protein
MKAFFIDVLMTGSGLGVYSNCFATLGEEPSPTSSSFSFDALDDHLVVEFLGGIVPALTHKITMAQVEDLPKAMQRQVVGVPRAWVQLFQHLVDSIVCYHDTHLAPQAQIPWSCYVLAIYVF